MVPRCDAKLWHASQAAVGTGKQNLERAKKALEEDRSRVKALQQAAAEQEAAAAACEAAATAAVQEAERKSAEAAATLARSAEKDAELDKMHNDVWAKVSGPLGRSTPSQLLQIPAREMAFLR